ncbi:hypothetical protein GOODEAATRI_016075, partial [Goodea atripinnis]
HSRCTAVHQDRTADQRRGGPPHLSLCPGVHVTGVVPHVSEQVHSRWETAVRQTGPAATCLLQALTWWNQDQTQVAAGARRTRGESYTELENKTLIQLGPQLL